jgi:hypothetical protein
VARTCRSDLTLVDDISMLPAGQDAAEAYYRITDAVYEHCSVAVSSNVHPDGAVISWTVPEFLESLGATAKLPTLRQKLR